MKKYCPSFRTFRTVSICLLLVALAYGVVHYGRFVKEAYAEGVNAKKELAAQALEENRKDALDDGIVVVNRSERTGMICLDHESPYLTVKEINWMMQERIESYCKEKSQELTSCSHTETCINGVSRVSVWATVRPKSDSK